MSRRAGVMIVLLVLQGAFVSAQDIQALRVGDTFTVETIIAQETKLIIGGGEPTIHQWTERFVVSYRRLPPESDRIFEVALLDTNRRGVTIGGPGRMDMALTRPRMKIVVDEAGRTKLSGELPEFFRSESDESSLQKLQLLTTPDVVLSWVNAPFWLMPPEPPALDLEWNRQHVLSLGLAGNLLTKARCRIQDLVDGEATVGITGEGTIVAANPALQSSKRLRCDDVVGKLTTFEGTGTLKMPAPDSSEPPAPGPFFQRRTLHWVIEGSATFHSGSRDRPVRFVHDQQQESKLLSSAVRRNSFPRQLPVTPLPQ